MTGSAGFFFLIVCKVLLEKLEINVLCLMLIEL